MSALLAAVHCEGIRVDCLGNYLAGLGLLAAASRRWPNVRGCWRRGHFVLLGNSLNAETVERFLLEEWRPSAYERWWKDAQGSDAKSDRAIQAARGEEPDINRVRLLDCHIIGCGARRQFNQLFLNGGSKGQRNLERLFRNALSLVRKTCSPVLQLWMRNTLFGESASLPALASAGTWFVYANERFNSGQRSSREKGWISPWAILLALEGARLLRGGAGRRLGSRARPYAVFPFLCDAPSPATEGEVKLTRAEFWAPLWDQPANFPELEALLERGLARAGDRAAQAPHEFALAARSAGVDSGVAAFARFCLRQTTSPHVFEAIPGESIEVARDARSESDLLLPLLHQWLKFLPEPPSSTQKGKFRGMRGPVEREIIRVAEQPDDASRWQSLLLLLASVQDRLDRNKAFRERSRPVPALDREWFDRAWPDPPPELRVARALASIGARPASPLLVNVAGVDVDKWGRRSFPPSRPSRAVFHAGDPERALAGILERRLIPPGPKEPAGLPLRASCHCAPGDIADVLAGEIDLEAVVRWLPAVALLNWGGEEKTAAHPRATSGGYLLHALFRPFFHPGKVNLDGQPLFEEDPPVAVARRLLYSIRSEEWAQAFELARSRYQAAGYRTIRPPATIGADGERLAAALLIPMRTEDVAEGAARWLEPHRTK